MIKGIGTDIVEIERIKKAILRQGFNKKVYTMIEQFLIEENGIQTAATGFAAKEAIAKAFGTGFSKFLPRDIEILRKTSGQPFCMLHGKALDIATERDITTIHISLSHCKDYAIAYVILT